MIHFLLTSAKPNQSNKPFYMKLSFEKIINYIKLISLLIVILITDGGCATQNKHRKIKSVPCPCLNQK